MSSWLQRRVWHRDAERDYWCGWRDAVAGMGRNPSKTNNSAYNRRFRVAYDAGYRIGETRKEPFPVPGEQLPIEVWALVLAEGQRP